MINRVVAGPPRVRCQRGRAGFSYQSSCGDHTLQRTHAVSRHCLSHPGHRPFVSNVFQQCPHPGSHAQRSSFPGCHLQAGHRMRRKSCPSSSIRTVGFLWPTSKTTTGRSQNGSMDSSTRVSTELAQGTIPLASTRVRTGSHCSRVEWWRRRDSHPRPKIHPRRNLRCVSASEISLPASRSGEQAPEASPGSSRHRRPRQRAGNQPAEMTSSPGPQADRGGRSQRFRLRERAACPQLWLFPSD